MSRAAAQAAVHFTLYSPLGILLFRDAFSVEYGNLSVDFAPILPAPGPIFRNILHGQIQHFEQAVICWENGLGLGDFPELAVKSLNSVCGVNQPTELFRELEISAEIWPVPAPGFRNLGILLVSFFGKIIQGIQGAFFIHRGIHPLQISHERFNVLV